MRLYSVQTEQTRRRAWRVAARDEQNALRAVRASMPPGARIIGTPELCDHGMDDGSGKEALGILLGQEYLADDTGAPMLIEDWVLRAHSLAHVHDGYARVNARLAPVGLRVYGPTFYVGSAASLPSLALIFEGTQWAGQGLTAALRRIEGARPTNMTFQGQRSRAVGLPMSLIVAGADIRAEGVACP